MGAWKMGSKFMDHREVLVGNVSYKPTPKSFVYHDCGVRSVCELSDMS